MIKKNCLSVSGSYKCARAKNCIPYIDCIVVICMQRRIFVCDTYTKDHIKSAHSIGLKLIIGKCASTTKIVSSVLENCIGFGVDFLKNCLTSAQFMDICELHMGNGRCLLLQFLLVICYQSSLINMLTVF